ncbi:tRNA (adenosine(37)-N6)-threonylcarbamoyltransferase complex ATPase subunit type 1 TsaE [Coxiella endosymbiont of Rhipicephalus microplus]|uniref:tRNA (adenosine(37)-N6)-threonylcarbamoyltransferase complex ATPase subunit type 1 TsaE n=1 Tax=Coxiella endosymbiont of Rhipicephalus microplus TaxID=1656186 RepID=UPI000CA6ACF4|nr:tRNA (adenosine(37)-N6)-threonylcarbamoyltransferase complex ATPase subunit type 1 TsaE [Coxiella endosymbiont of Rhipicephalus microplus]PMB54546.1 TsaE protein, required for threonylcarbamoyladenosine t(6)A37 formation in tRNA [Coxiella-like endosymbiont]
MIISFTPKIISSEKEMLLLGQKIANFYPKGSVIYLSGELGSGKTTLVRGFLRGLGYRGLVKSPTYSLIEIYKLSTVEIVHVDLYRLEEPEEYLNLGLSDYLKNNSILLIEWPEKSEKFLPFRTLWIKINIRDKKRIVKFSI